MGFRVESWVLGLWDWQIVLLKPLVRPSWPMAGRVSAREIFQGYQQLVGKDNVAILGPSNP